MKYILDPDDILAWSRLTAAEEHAVFLGSFDPATICDDQGASLPVAVVEALAEQCVEQEGLSGFQWAMTPDARARVFERLGNAKRLNDAAKRAMNAGLDELGSSIVKLVLNPSMSFDDLSRSEIEKLRIAGQLLGSALDPSPLPLIDSALNRAEAVAAIDFVRSKKLIGRELELAKLAAFIRPAPVAGAPPSPSWMGITGIGGSGKSALLAEFVHRLRQDNWGGAPIVWMDFDRPRLSNADMTDLMSEFARQVAMYHNQAAQGIKQFRDAVQKISEREGSHSSYEKHSSTTSTITSLWFAHVPESFAPNAPLLLILDTFEEVLMRGEAEQIRIEQWINALTSEYGFKNLQVLFSARILPADFPRLRLQQLPPLLLGNLSTEDAVTLFDHLTGVQDRASEIRSLIDKFGGNPLLIKILAQLVQAEGAGAVADLATPGAITNSGDALVQGILYTRILRRLRSHDQDVARLAHPGLVLRRVTPDLIQYVLAQPCELNGVDKNRAGELFNELARQIWLVERASDQRAVIHRKDLRRLMLQLMEPDMAHRARLIHQLAAEYYTALRDPEMDELSQRREANYHLLFLGKVKPTNKEDARDLIKFIGTDIDCLDVETVARLKYRAEFQLSSDELETLSDASQVLYIMREGEKQQRASGAAPAAEYVRSAPISVSFVQEEQHTYSPGTAEREVNSYTVISAFANGELEWIARNTFKLINIIFRERTESVSVTEGRDMIDSSVWQMALATLGSGDASRLAEDMGERLQALERAKGDEQRWRVGQRNSISFSRAIRTVQQLLAPSLELRWSELKTKRHSPYVQSMDELRALQMLGNPDRDWYEPLEVSLQLLRFASPGFRLARTNKAPASLASIDGHQWTLMWGDVQKRGASLASLNTIALDGPPLRLSGKKSSNETSEKFDSMLPELYPLIRWACREIPAEKLIDFSQRQSNKHGVLWPVELHPENLATALAREQERWLSTLIETTDRFGDLEALLDIKATYPGFPTGLQTTKKLLQKLEERLNYFSS